MPRRPPAEERRRVVLDNVPPRPPPPRCEIHDIALGRFVNGREIADELYCRLCDAEDRQ